MNRLFIIGILILMHLVLSGYVSSSPNEVVEEVCAEGTGRYLDAHLSYYEEHLITMGIERCKP